MAAATMPVLFSFSEYSHVNRSLCDLPGIEPGRFAVVRYPNQELRAVVQSTVAGKHCLILGSIAPPDSQMVSLLLLAHTLRKEGANRITGLLPYLAYAREDKIKAGESLATAWVGALLKASAFDQIWAVDLHSEHDKQLYPLPIESLSPAAIFAECLKQYGLTDASFVAPDQGAMWRCEALTSAVGKTSDAIVYFQKRRTASGIVHQDPVGRVKRRAVVVDDVLDTGATLVSACEKLLAAGAQELYICVTHGLFTEQHWRDLWSLAVKRIFCTDTIPACASIQDPRIITLPIGPLLRTKLASILDVGPGPAETGARAASAQFRLLQQRKPRW
jgi:ribose-phosphate pyrophosphokinase